jgi:rhodanese-related sulfurtransferase
MNLRTLISSLLLIFGPSSNASTIVKQPLALTGKVIGIDVRTGLELKINASPGAVHIPLMKLQSSEKLPRDKSKEIYVFCESGGRSAKAQKILKSLGYSKVKDVTDWRTWNKLNTL